MPTPAASAASPARERHGVGRAERDRVGERHVDVVDQARVQSGAASSGSPSAGTGSPAAASRSRRRTGPPRSSSQYQRPKAITLVRQIVMRLEQQLRRRSSRVLRSAVSEQDQCVREADEAEQGERDPPSAAERRGGALAGGGERHDQDASGPSRGARPPRQPPERPALARADDREHDLTRSRGRSPALPPSGTRSLPPEAGLRSAVGLWTAGAGLRPAAGSETPLHKRGTRTRDRPRPVPASRRPDNCRRLLGGRPVARTWTAGPFPAPSCASAAPSWRA